MKKEKEIETKEEIFDFSKQKAKHKEMTQTLNLKPKSYQTLFIKSTIQNLNHHLALDTTVRGELSKKIIKKRKTGWAFLKKQDLIHTSSDQGIQSKSIAHTKN